VISPDLTGVILAGGKSTRMGSDKALLRLGGKFFLERIAGSLSPVADTVVISAGEVGKYSELGFPVITDIHHDCGALGGIHAVLSQISTSRAFFISCDLPLVTEVACQRIADTVTGNDVVIGRCDGRIHPLFGIYNKNVLPVVERCLAVGRYSVMSCLEELIVTVVDFSDPALMFNINTPEDYRRLLEADAVSAETLS